MDGSVFIGTVGTILCRSIPPAVLVMVWAGQLRGAPSQHIFVAHCGYRFAAVTFAAPAHTTRIRPYNYQMGTPRSFSNHCDIPMWYSLSGIRLGTSIFLGSFSDSEFAFQARDGRHYTGHTRAVHCLHGICASHRKAGVSRVSAPGANNAGLAWSRSWAGRHLESINEEVG